MASMAEHEPQAELREEGATEEQEGETIAAEEEEATKMGVDESEEASKAKQMSSSSNSGGGGNNNLENIKVAVRLRPFTEKERQRTSKRIVDIEQNTVALYRPKANSSDESSSKKFTFDYSYWSHDGFRRNAEGVNVPDEGHPSAAKYVSQERVFADLGRFLLENALEGYNSALLAYGQTGSGKSYTVSGYGQNEGIVPRFARELFAELDRRRAVLLAEESLDDRDSGGATTKPEEVPASDQMAAAEAAEGERTNPQEAAVEVLNKRRKNRFEVYFSMIEIYNEVVRDLLAKQSSTRGGAATAGPAMPAARRGLRVREHPKRGFFVESLTSIECANKEEIERLIEEGQLNKSIAATSMNETSSRGHTIYEFHIRQYKMARRLVAVDESAVAEPPRREVDTLTTSVVQLVDLAGSERMAVHMVGGPAAGPPNADQTTRSSSPFPGAAPLSGQTIRTGRRAHPGSAASSSSSSATTTTTGNIVANNYKTASLRRLDKQQQQQQQTSSTLGPLNLMTGNHQQRFKESVSINQSLSALGNCIQVLSQYSQQQQQQQQVVGIGGDTNKQQPKIPYRDSVLTKLLNRCCLSGNSKVVLIATLSPAEANYDDTLSTLRFADRAKQIRTHAVINRSQRSQGGAGGGEAVNALQRENQRLKQMLDGRVTRSDDSSQTSNFDDTENMLDNFNGPRVGGSGGGGEIRPSQATAATAGASSGSGATLTRARLAASRNPAAAGNTRARARSNVRAGQSDKAGPATPQRSLVGGRGARKQNNAAAIAQEATQQQAGTAPMRISASNPALARQGDAREQMKQLVSPGKRKMRQNTRTLNSNARSESEELQHKLRKSRSLGQGLAGAATPTAAGSGDLEEGVADEETDEGGRLLAGGELELASSLLDEIDLNELASIIDDENLLSGAESSDDSLSGGGGGRATGSRQPLEEAGGGAGHLTSEEKMSILNKILNSNNSDKSTKAIKQKLEENLAAAAAAATSGEKNGKPRLAQRQGARKGAAGGGTTTTGGSTTAAVPNKPQRSHNLRPTLRDGAEPAAPAARGPRASQLKRTNPYLSNLNPDEQLTGMITYIVRPGEMIVGKSGNCDLLIYGPGLRGQHARLVRTLGADGSSEVSLEPIVGQQTGGEATTVTNGQKPRRVALMVNGEPVLERTRLAHGDRLLFGSTNYFVFIDHNHSAAQASGGSSGENSSSARTQLDASLDMVTYEMAHQEVLRKIMSDAENEAMIREINDYTHRPGTGKHRRGGGGGGGAEHQVASTPPQETPSPAVPGHTEVAGAAEQPNSSAFKMSRGASSRLTRSMTIHDTEAADGTVFAPGDTPTSDPPTASGDGHATRQLDKIKEEAGELAALTSARPALDSEEQPEAGQPLDEQYRGKLMEDTYEFAMPIAEANAIAKEMGIRVTYGLKILTGEEQLLLNGGAGGGETGSGRASEDSEADYAMTAAAAAAVDEDEQSGRQAALVSEGRDALRPETLDVPPELYVHVHLDELQGVDFYWSKEKFQERREKMLELYGAWDVGGKSGLVEYLIEQSKYQGYYMIDPFVDELRSSYVLLGHAQVTLAPLAHLANLLESEFDVLDVNDEIVGQVRVEAAPCEPASGPAGPYRKLSERQLSASFLEQPSQLLGKRLVFLLQILSCTGVPARFTRVFAQYTLNRDRAVVRTKLARLEPADANSDLHFNHAHYVVLDEVTPDLLDFFQHGFLTIQLVGQYNLEHVVGSPTSQQQPPPPAAEASTATDHTEDTPPMPVGASSKAQSAGAGSVQSGGSSSRSQASSVAQPTLISTIISSINKYRFRMEQQGALMSAGGTYSTPGGYAQQGGGSGGASNSALNQYSSPPYANSLTDSTKSGGGGGYHHHGGVLNSNSGASSVTSASATINLFDQQQEDDEGSGSMNGATQENIIDMILTKRKLDRAENQLHYIKRTINIAEHYNKKHIPVRTVKKLLNSYGQELESGSLEEMAAEVTTETKSAPSGKSSGCTIQ